MKDSDFNDLLKSIDQARAIHRGELRAQRTYKFDPLVVKKIRQKLHQSQTQFAYMIGVSVDTLQNWEQGRRKPEGPALALLRVAEASPEIVMEALHN
jgi:putative transcriptional regulator